MALIDCPNPNCSNKVSDKAERCPRCGYVLHRTPTKVSPQQEEKKTVVIETPQESPNPKPPKSNRGRWILISCMFLIIAVCIGGYVWHVNNQKQVAALRLQHEQDSIAAVQREIARLDSLHQDSINAVTAFQASIIKLSDIISFDGTPKQAFFTPDFLYNYSTDEQFHSYFKTLLQNNGYILKDTDTSLKSVEGGEIQKLNSYVYEKKCEKNNNLWNRVIVRNGAWKDISVEFCDNSEANSFWEECKSIGFRKSRYGSYLVENADNDTFDMWIEREGNIVTINNGGL